MEVANDDGARHVSAQLLDNVAERRVMDDQRRERRDTGGGTSNSHANGSHFRYTRSRGLGEIADDASFSARARRRR
jgi:hypothetical protein